MRVGSVKTRPGRPTIACEPKSAIAFTKATSAPERTAGATSGPVTASAVRHRPAAGGAGGAGAGAEDGGGRARGERGRPTGPGARAGRAAAPGGRRRAAGEGSAYCPVGEGREGAAGVEKRDKRGGGAEKLAGLL